MSSWDDLVWVEYEQLWQDLGRLPEKPGAYAVRYAPKGEPKTIPRAFGADASGVLCFGRTTTRQDGLKGRLTDLCRAVRGKSAPHVEGRRYYDLGYHRRGFPVEDLQVAWVHCRLPEEAKSQEEAWFDEYLFEYGELPPLNRRRG